jgi:hypothetical protein
MLVVPKTSTTVWVLILLFGTPTATTTLLPTLAALLTTLVLTTLATLPALLAALILPLTLRHHYLPSFGSLSLARARHEQSCASAFREQAGYDICRMGFGNNYFCALSAAGLSWSICCRVTVSILRHSTRCQS